MHDAAGPRRPLTLAVTAFVWLVVAAIPIGPDAFSARVWAADYIRSLSSVCQWDHIRWDDMSQPERQAWITLGWTAQRWDSNAAPASSSKDWTELTANEDISLTN
jgi:hypothetical protein